MNWKNDLSDGKSYKRGERRQQKDKKKKQAREIYPHDSHAETLADHIKHCSCYECRNPRRDGEKTRQEIKAELKMREELDGF
jgi:hypothetical protein